MRSAPISPKFSLRNTELRAGPATHDRCGDAERHVLARARRLAELRGESRSHPRAARGSPCARRSSRCAFGYAPSPSPCSAAMRPSFVPEHVEVRGRFRRVREFLHRKRHHPPAAVVVVARIHVIVPRAHERSRRVDADRCGDLVLSFGRAHHPRRSGRLGSRDLEPRGSRAGGRARTTSCRLHHRRRAREIRTNAYARRLT